jgi:hypothetical protein
VAIVSSTLLLLSGGFLYSPPNLIWFLFPIPHSRTHSSPRVLQEEAVSPFASGDSILRWKFGEYFPSSIETLRGNARKNLSGQALERRL